MQVGQRFEAGVFAAMLCVGSIGCGSEQDAGSQIAGSNGGGSAGSGGTGGVPPISIGDGGPDSGSAGSGGSTGSGGSSGSAGLGGAPPVAPAPTFDCQTFTGSNHCISAAGFIDGVPFDFSCRADLGGYRLRATDGYGLNCWETAEQPYVFHLSLPTLEPGTLQITLAADAGTDRELRVTDSTINKGASSRRENLDSGSVSVTFAQAPAETVSGTFEARWRGGGTACEGCVPVSIRGSFRSVFDF